METIRPSVSAEGKKPVMIYVGDGTPDFCAGLKLEEGDYLIPRKNFPMWELICENPMLIKANIHEWNSWEELAALLINTTNTSFIEDLDKCTTTAGTARDCKIEDTGSTISTHSSSTLRVPH